MPDREVSIPLGGFPPNSSGQREVSIKIGTQTSRLKNTSADVVFVIDTTGSMDNEIGGLLATSQTFVDELAKKEIDWQIAIISFGDLTVPGDQILATSFSKNA